MIFTFLFFTFCFSFACWSVFVESSAVNSLSRSPETLERCWANDWWGIVYYPVDMWCGHEQVNSEQWQKNCRQAGGQIYEHFSHLLPAIYSKHKTDLLSTQQCLNRGKSYKWKSFEQREDLYSPILENVFPRLVIFIRLSENMCNVQKSVPFV